MKGKVPLIEKPHADFIDYAFSRIITKYMNYRGGLAITVAYEIQRMDEPSIM